MFQISFYLYIMTFSTAFCSLINTVYDGKLLTLHIIDTMLINHITLLNSKQRLVDNMNIMTYGTSITHISK